MKFSFKTWATVFIIAWIYNFTDTHFVSGQCLPDQKSLLVELRNKLEFDYESSTKLVTWNNSKPCCHWGGVQCEKSSSRVIGLDLSVEAITGGIDNFNSLFRLQHLKWLNLAYNPISRNIPPSIGNLSALTYLNLSHTGFSGQVPIQMSQLVNLLILDLSTNKDGDDDMYTHSALQIRSTSLAVIMQNLTQLKELYLGGIVLSEHGIKWGKALSSLKNLQVLSMPNCDLRGGFHPSLAHLRSLSVIELGLNRRLSSPVPEFFATFTNLTILRLYLCSLTGIFPQQIFQLPSLAIVRMTYNEDLRGNLPSFMGNLTKLTQLDLSECNFQGIIPPSIGNLPQLEYLDLSTNNFSGSIPMFLSANNLSHIILDDNSLTGRIPESMFSKDSQLRVLILSSNNLEGSIPKTIFQLPVLEVLELSFTKLTGTIKLHRILTSLPNLVSLDLSYSRLSINANDTGSNFSFFLDELNLASCNLHILPEFLKNQPYLYQLDLSNNHIQGKIPEWIWYGNSYYLNLSYNSFVIMEQFPSIFPSNFKVLDLHANNLQGELPLFPSQTPLEFLDLSNNSFTTTIDPNFGSSVSSAQYISLARNMIHGNIPQSLCKVTSLQVLDLSFNNLNGTIPICLPGISQNLAILNLRRNALHGAIPDEFGVNCTLETLDFNMNHLDGHIPSSIANCKYLKVLDLGNNHLTGTFPCHLKQLSTLQVLILRCNQLQGNVICAKSGSFLPLLQIIDLASNHFSGQLSTLFHGRRMMSETSETQSALRFLQYQSNESFYNYYQDQVVVTFKNSEFEMQKILTIFSTIDLSNNAFHGVLPEELGNLNALKVLNLSRNSLSGSIPKSIGNMSQLESLDLSRNSLNGNIPPQLASLSFIGYLNLSFNNLTGLIPTSTQLQSFDATSYEGNPGLYGPPLTGGGNKGRGRPTMESEDGSEWNSRSRLRWMLSGAAVGYSLGIILFFGPLVFIERWREWYNYQVDRQLMKILPSEESRKQNRRKASRKQRHGN